MRKSKQSAAKKGWETRQKNLEESLVKKLEEYEKVNQPAHYKMGTVEVLDFILDQNVDYLTGQVLKYMCRWPYKNDPIGDLKKAEFYLKRLIAEQEAAG